MFDVESLGKSVLKRDNYLCKRQKVRRIRLLSRSRVPYLFLGRDEQGVFRNRIFRVNDIHGGSLVLRTRL